MSKTFVKLFEPGQIGKMKLKNRIVMPPMVVNYAGVNGEVTDRMINYYAERAKGGTGLIIIEAVEVDYPNGLATAIPPTIHQDRYIAGFNKLAEAIHMYNAKAAVQLHHGGRQAFTMEGQQPVAPSPIPCKVKQQQPRELTIEEIHDLVEKYAKAALRVKQAGFDAVEIHGGHGYIITQFMCPYTNKRVDMYGGTFERRMRFPIEIVQRTRELVGDDFPIIFRISADTFVEGGLTLEDSKRIAKMLEEAGVDAIHVTAAIYETIPKLIDAMSYPEGWRVYLGEEIKKVVNIPVITVGQIRTPELAERIIAEGKADFVALGRQLIADPYWPQKARENRVDDIRRCISCNVGCVGRIFVCLPAACTVNAQAGREKEFEIKPAEKKKNVMIIGGGPAGMEAARVAALRGHNVTLYEKSETLGGQLNLASVPPGKDKIRWYKEYLISQINKLGVKVKLGIEVTPEVVEKEKPDVVILVTGGQPLIPDIPGVDGDNVVTAWDVLNGKVNIASKKVIIAGGGMVGCETALYLAEKGNEVTIVEMLDEIARDMDFISRMDLLEKIASANISVRTKLRVDSITKDGIIVMDRKQRRQFIEADIIVLSLGVIPLNELESMIRDRVPELYVIGDGKQPGKIIDATYDGYLVANMI